MIDRLAVASTWLDTRMAMRLDADALRRRRERLWRRMRPILERTSILRAHAGRHVSYLPIISPSDMRRDVSAWNSAGIGHDEAMQAAHDAEHGGSGEVRDGIVAGLSTGTTGERGLFLASREERARYVGQSLARMLPGHALLSGARIALVLRADSALYRDAGRGRFSFLHLPLGLDACEMARRIVEFRPTVLIAPPRELSSLARIGTDLSGLSRLFWGSEPMADAERQWITSRLGIRPDPIYQATEGFIAAPCRHGRLHLNDDSMEIELEPVPGLDVYRPIVTDLRRHIQPMVRVRMDDLIRLDGRPCACGFGGRVVDPVLGRIQDVWHLPRGAVLPDRIDDLMTHAVGDFARWRVRGSTDRISLAMDDADLVPAARAALQELAPGLPIDVEIRPDADGPKRRRVTWEK